MRWDYSSRGNGNNIISTLVTLLLADYDNYFFLYDNIPIDISDITTKIAPNIVT